METNSTCRLNDYVSEAIVSHGLEYTIQNYQVIRESYYIQKQQQISINNTITNTNTGGN